MDISVALDGSLVRNLRLSPGDEVTLNLTVYEHDGDSAGIAYTAPSMAVGDGADLYPIGTEFSIPLDLGRTPYRIAVEIAGVVTTVAYGFIETTQPGSCSVVCSCGPVSSSSSSGGGGGGAVDSVNGQTGVVVLDAGDIAYTPAGGIAATDVQTALTELDTEKQAANANLTALAGLTGAADKLPYFTALATLALTTFTAFGRTMLAWVDAAAARTGLGLGTSATLNVDTDGTFAANSDTRVPSQKAVKTYADQLIAAQDAMVFKGVIDCSANPNYPAADRGWTYRVSVAGKIGGASGTNVEAGDILLCLTDGTVSGTQAAVGASWTVIQVNMDGGVIGPASAVDGNVALFDTTTGKLIKDGGTFAALLAAAIHAATNKATPADADEVGIADSAASYGLKRLTLVNLAAYVFSGWGPRIAAATAKATPVNADGVLITDSAASGAAKFLSFTNLKAFLKTYFDTLYLALVAPGSNGNVLTVAGGVWTSATPASSTPAAVVLAINDIDASGAVAAADFTSLINGTYGAYEFELHNITPVTGSARLYFQFSIDGGATWKSTSGDYIVGEVGVRVSTGGVLTFASTTGTFIELDGANGTSNTTADGGVSGKFTLFEPASTTRHKEFRFEIASAGGASEIYTLSGGGKCTTTSAVNAVRVKWSTGNHAGGLIIMKGLRKAV